MLWPLAWSLSAACVVVGVGVWGVLVENCIVDASIFAALSRRLFWVGGVVLLVFVVKLIRAHGGCLGIRSR